MAGDKKPFGGLSGTHDANRHGAFRPGQSGNPGGKPSIANDLKRAAVIGIPVEISEVLDEWALESHARLRELGPDGFIAGLRAALEDATKRIPPVDAAEARAMWWRTILPIAFAGPQGPKDSNWTYANQEVGVRLMGKPKETIAIEGSEAPAIDWNKVPEDEREGLLQAIVKLQGYVSAPSPTEH